MRSISISAEFLSEIERVLAAHAPADAGAREVLPQLEEFSDVKN
jgi:hypothetical protein